MLVAMPFDDEASLLKKPNNSVFGLAAGIWTRDYRRLPDRPRTGSRHDLDQHLQAVLNLDAI